MFNQFKLLLLVIIFGILVVLFFQNQEPISLKLLCADPSSQYCWYQTPTQPLAMWMGLFLSLGVVSSLIWQLLQNLGLSEADYDYGDRYIPSSRQEDINSRKSAPRAAVKTAKTTRQKPSTSTSSDWEYSGQKQEWEESEVSPSSKVDPPINRDDTIRGYSFEAKQKPQNINRSSSTYSYQFKKKPQSEDPVKNNQNEVYDANYRTINAPNRNNNVNQQTELDEDEEDWI